MNNGAPLVYDDIVTDLIRSIMRAQKELLTRMGDGSVYDVPNKFLNQHFSWLAWAIPEGQDRHLFEPEPGNSAQFPLRTSDLREKKNAPGKIKDLLERRLSPVEDPENPEDPGWKFVRVNWRQRDDAATRISSLIKRAHVEVMDASRVENKGSADENAQVLISPLAIALDYLTAPEFPGTRAYAFFSLRNFIFAKLGVLPAHGSWSEVEKALTAHAVRQAMSAIHTSLRSRPDSKGKDTLLAGDRAGRVVRNILAMRKMLLLRFPPSGELRGKEVCQQFLEQEAPLSEEALSCVEYQKSPFLERLPDTSEILNEIFGLPLPLRGADTIFRGGLRFPAREGLVVAIHGGAGAGKTTLAMGLCAALRPMGVLSYYITAEENEEDLASRIDTTIPDAVQRMKFMHPYFLSSGDKIKTDGFVFEKIDIENFTDSAPVEFLEKKLENIAYRINRKIKEDRKKEKNDGIIYIPQPCGLVVVLDGLHDLLYSIGNEPDDGARYALRKLRKLVETLKKLKALVLLTVSEKWVGDTILDYLVDVSIRLRHESLSEYGLKPYRTMELLKARHQLCAPGAHGMQLAGEKGLRFSPQINYKLDERAHWKGRLPNTKMIKRVFQAVVKKGDVISLREEKKGKKENKEKEEKKKGKLRYSGNFFTLENGDYVKVFKGSHIFINGMGSGGKAGLALKIAMHPAIPEDAMEIPEHSMEKILIISFLYPEEYYKNIINDIKIIIKKEISAFQKEKNQKIEIQINLNP